MFPAMWIPLKLLQSCGVARLLALARAERAAAPGALLPSTATTAALAAFAVMTALGNAWNVTFFGRRKLRASFRVMLAFWASLAVSIGTAHRADASAGLLIAPTIGWVTVAAALNLAIVRLNKDKWE
jgi:tryptophan-rich sensory protein